MDSRSLRLPATLDNLGAFISFSLERLGESCPDNVVMALGTRLELVLEELLVNVINHAYAGREGEVEIRCNQSSGTGCEFCMEIRDSGPPFDPLAHASPDTGAAMDDRDIGGLGIHLVREMTSSLHYERQGDHNVLSFCLSNP